jgi:hypothetical protein
VSERLQKLQERLIEQGVLDVKFTLAPRLTSIPTRVLDEDLCDLLEAYLDGEYVVVERINDHVR